MKLSFNGLRSIFVILACFIAAFVQVNAQGTEVQTESFPNVFNSNATGNINSTFVGDMGTWSASSNRTYASVAVISYWKNATPNSLFIKNFKGSSASSSIATSPNINLSAYTCAPNATLIFNVDPSKLSGSNTGTIYTIDFSNNGGSTWATMISQTAAQIKTAMPLYGWNLGTLDIPASYLVSNFKFRITGSSPANSAYDNEIYFDDLSIYVPTCSPNISTCTNGTSFNPFSDAQGFNVFSKGALEFIGGEVEGSVAGGGNLTLNGASRIAINNSGSYPNAFASSSNYSLVVGGRMYYTSGGVSYINNGFFNLANTTGTKLWDKDPNNANVNLRATSNAQSSWNGYNSQPALQVQQQQTVASATSSSGLNFTTTFTSVVANSNLIASYNASSPCNASLNIISISGTSPSITLVDNKINVINITGSYFSTLSKITFTNKPTSTRPVIFNMSGTAGYTFNNFQAVGISNSDAPYILYNFSAVTGTIQMGGANTLYGSVLIPNGKFIWTNSNNVEGQILANLFTLSAGEIHYNPYNVCLPICTVSYSLGDFVWYDVNNNGIQDAGEPGISGVTVNLYADANGDNIPDGAAIATTTTNGSGAYSFSNLSSGKYVIAVVVPSGYSTGTTTGTSSNPNNTTANDNNGVAVYNTTLVRSNSITLNSDNPNVDFGFVNCVKQIETFPNQYNTGFGKPITNGTFTGSTGTFTVNTSANASIVVLTPYYSPGTSYAIKVVNWATNGSMSETPTPGVGTTSVLSPKVDLSSICCPAELKLEYKLWTYTVNASDNTTTLSWEFSNDNGSTWNVMNTITSAQIASLYGASTVVNLSIPVPVMYQNSNFRYRIKSNKPINNPYNFYVFIDDIKISSPVSCASTYTLGDYVWFDVNNNGIQNAGEPGIANVAVNLYYDLNNDNIPDGGPIATTTTNASGAYSFSGLASNRYIVSIVEPTGYDPATTTGTSSDPNNSTANDNNGVAVYNTTEVRSNSINLTANNPNVDFGLKGILNLGNLVWNDTNGNGIKNTFESGINGVTVYLYQDANGDNVPDGAAIATTTTAGGGLYNFINLAPGNYIVGIVEPAGYAKSFTPLSGSTPNNNTDNDNNGIANFSGIIRSNFITLSVGGEPAAGIDGDGTNGNLTLDFAIAKDTDGDDIPDVIDIDDDNDGITDMNESGGYDPLGDCDNDGIPNYLDTTPGCPTPSGNDPWGVPYKPLVFTDCNADGINDFFDWDRDGIINELDLDSDNDGILDVYEARPNGVQFTSVVNGMITGTDTDENGLLSSAENGNPNPVLNGLAAQDMDRDGTPNFLDLDSDGDGITDLTEALGVYSSTGVVTGTDTDGDGVRAENFSSSAASVADNVNGFGARGILLLDSDNDGKPNAYDIDSDNDGITDNAEGQATCSYKLPTGTDCDGDGVDDSYDAGGCSSCLRTSGGITPFDKDGDGTPDYLDLDTDNDGALDIYEGHSIPTPNGNVPPLSYWIAQMGDSDKDGLYDYFDGFNIVNATGGNYWRNVINNNMGNSGTFDTGTGATGSISQLPKSQVSTDCNVGDRDWRNIVILPVSLIDFNGNLNSNIAKLNWSVTTEVNMNEYSIERSTDGVNFNTIATVKAGNNVTSISNYTVSDNLAGLNATTVYYKLKMVEKNGAFKNSKTISFKLNSIVKGGVSLMPNPASSFVNIKVSAIKEGVASVKIIDMLGRVVSLQNTKVLTGVNTFTFNNLNTLSAGTYNVQVLVDGTMYNEKLVVSK